jgi:multicomponent Na+:H+ antiporter subunit C
MGPPAVEIFAVLMFFIGFYGVITGRNIIKSIVSIGLMEMAAVVFFLSLGYTEGAQPPIGRRLVNVADPLPQALMITAIIIGVTVSAVNVTMLISLSRQSKTTDWDSVKKKNEE